MKTSKRGMSDPRSALVVMVKRLDQHTAAALLTLLEILLDLDRAAAIRLLEAMSALLVRAPRRAAGRGRS